MPKRNRYKPTDEERNKVRALAGFGFTLEEISLVIHRGVPTIKHKFKRELKDGPTVANAKVIETLYKIAVQQNKDGSPIASSAQVTALSLWVKVRANWATIENVKVTGLPTTELPASALRSLTNEELKLLETIARRVEAAEAAERAAG